jgi:hypothetical protein
MKLSPLDRAIAYAVKLFKRREAQAPVVKRLVLPESNEALTNLPPEGADYVEGARLANTLLVAEENAKLQRDRFHHWQDTVKTATIRSFKDLKLPLCHSDDYRFYAVDRDLSTKNEPKPKPTSVFPNLSCMLEPAPLKTSETPTKKDTKPMKKTEVKERYITTEQNRFVNHVISNGWSDMFFRIKRRETLNDPEISHVYLVELCITHHLSMNDHVVILSQEADSLAELKIVRFDLMHKLIREAQRALHEMIDLEIGAFDGE